MIIRRKRRVRRGMILPLVLVGMLLVTTLSAALQLAAWRAQRGSQSQWDAQRGTYAADLAIVRTIAEWSSDSMVMSPIGARMITTETASDGWRIQTTVTRTAPLVALIRAVARRDHGGPAIDGTVRDGARIRRTVLRAVRLEPPGLPMLAVATVLGPTTVAAATFDGRDVPTAFDPMRDDCGPRRDSSSVAAFAATQVAEQAVPTWLGGVRVLDSAVTQEARQHFDSAFVRLSARAHQISAASTGALPATRVWRAVVTTDTTAVTLTAASHHVGLLAINGDLIVRGALRIDGLLVVRGAIHDSTGSLDVSGALVVRDHAQTGSHFAHGTRVRYAPCLAARALAAVAIPQTSTFGIWNSP